MPTKHNLSKLTFQVTFFAASGFVATLVLSGSLVAALIAVGLSPLAFIAYHGHAKIARKAGVFQDKPGTKL